MIQSQKAATMRPDPMNKAESRDLDAHKDQIMFALELFARWLRRHQAEHPEDRRPMLELLDVFAAEVDRLGGDLLITLIKRGQR
jgi:hypothetical protein